MFGDRWRANNGGAFRLRGIGWLIVAVLAATPLGAQTVPAPAAPTLRKFPHPYRAAMTITSDIDSCSVEEFLEIHQFLNTKQNTSENVNPARNTDMGVGVGLEIGDSFWMFTDYPTGGWTFSYYATNTMERGPHADLIRTYVHAGYLDVMHSFADQQRPDSFPRAKAEAALAEMKRSGMDVTVFTDHGAITNANNIGSPWGGDMPTSPQHHTDLSIWPRGPFRFIGNPGYTTVVGTPPRHPWTLRDGVKCYALSRYYDGALGWYVEELHREISAANLDKLVAAEGSMLAVNHFGLKRGGGNAVPVFSPAGREALRELERRHRNGTIYVTTAAKLIWYEFVRDFLVYESRPNAQGGLTIAISAVTDPIFGTFAPTETDLQGITFLVSAPKTTRVLLAGRDVTGSMQINPPDASGRASISFPLTRLPLLPEWLSDGTTRKTEDYAVPQFDYTFSVTNLDEVAHRPTLSYIGLHAFSIAEARAGSTCFIDAPDDKRIRLGLLQPGETLGDLKVLNGPWNATIPRLTGRTGGGELEAALYDATTGSVTLTLNGSEPTTLTLAYCGQPFAEAGNRIHDDGRQEVAVQPAGRTTYRSVRLRVTPGQGALEVRIDQWPTGAGPRHWRVTPDRATMVTHVFQSLVPGASYDTSIDGDAQPPLTANGQGEASFNWFAQPGEHRLGISPTPNGVGPVADAYRKE